jgi:hypothetical protein
MLFGLGSEVHVPGACQVKSSLPPPGALAAPALVVGIALGPTCGFGMLEAAGGNACGEEGASTGGRPALLLADAEGSVAVMVSGLEHARLARLARPSDTSAMRAMFKT